MVVTVSPFGKVTVTVLPASAVPSTVCVFSSLATTWAVGACGATASTVTDVDCDSLPALSFAVTVISLLSV
ncbi:hypothetical protein A6A20_06370 [Volucribacter amazonae]|uniref:Uncharacterized protein n=1 Tax=Volucribacter amazonae TaxID=256731 RepID=A0A9X4PDH2_9PAST|nr:hypothetical protein [Volucribacter amazonae]MDG6895249.1 hypothetical protein [Volucribacter amazonae]